MHKCVADMSDLDVVINQFPAGDYTGPVHSSISQSNGSVTSPSKIRRCKTCKEPMRGHRRVTCANKEALKSGSLLSVASAFENMNLGDTSEAYDCVPLNI